MELDQYDISGSLAAGDTITVDVPVAGAILFKDHPIYAFVDSTDVITESDEENNLASSQTPPVLINEDYSASYLRVDTSNAPDSVELTARSGNYEDVTITWENPPYGLYDIYVVVDDDGTGIGSIRESHESNNVAHTLIDLHELAPDYTASEPAKKASASGRPSPKAQAATSVGH